MLKRSLYSLLLLGGIIVCSGCYCSRKKESQSTISPKTIFTFLGAPGSGKGTLAEQCVKKLGFKVLSTGNLCRETIASGSEQGKMLADYINQGKLVPDELIANMVEGWLMKNAGSAPIILDGYPRTQKQAELFLALLKNKLPDFSFKIVGLTLPDDEIVKRISSRWVCSNKQCQAVYNKMLMKNKDQSTCTLCNAPLTQRADDKEEVVRQRLQVFAQTNNLLVSYYQTAGLAITTLSTLDLAPEVVFENFKKAVV
ncbi:MAG: nucleoside monophosphate kinase [Candidatus Babeliales bacterium]